MSDLTSVLIQCDLNVVCQKVLFSTQIILTLARLVEGSTDLSINSCGNPGYLPKHTILISFLLIVAETLDTFLNIVTKHYEAFQIQTFF